MTQTAEVFRRQDGKWAWHAIAANGQVVAGDESQGYENEGDAYDMMRRILGGEWAQVVGRSVPEDPGPVAIAAWVVETVGSMLPLGGATITPSHVDLLAAAIADRLHGDLWPTCTNPDH
jgi:uncharacterized protein YegP (UPF0339 family)